MAARDLLERWGGKVSRTAASASDDPPSAAPLGGTKPEAMQRLQVGLVGLSAMILIIGVASVIESQADIAEESAVPDAAPTTEPTAVLPQRDPLADAGVVPDIPAEPEPEPEEVDTSGEPVVTDGNVTVPDTPPTEQEDGVPEPSE